MTWPNGSAEMAERIRAHNWPATSLGPVDSWPRELRHSVELMLPHPLPMALLWGPGNIHLYNDDYAALIGPKHPAALGRPLREIGAELEHLDRGVIDRVRRGEAVLLKDIGCPPTSIDSVPDNCFDIAHSPLRDAAGQVAGVMITIFDKTAQSRAEHRLRDAEEIEAFLLRLSDILRPLTDPVEVQRTAMGLVSDHFSAIRALYFEIGPDGNLIRAAEGVDHSAVPPPTSLRISDFGGWISRALAQGHSIPICDVDRDARLDEGARAAFRSIGIRAAVGVPLSKGGRIVVAMAIHLAEPREWSAKDLHLVQEVAERTWEAVERARAESALRRSEQRLQLALDAASMGTFVWHVETDYFDYDARAHALFGMPQDATANLLATMPLSDIIHPDDLDRCIAATRRMLMPASDGQFREEFRIRLPEGEGRWLDVASQAVRREGAQVSHVVGTVRDVTGARQAQEALQGSEERLRVLVAELQHRVRNILTVVRSVFSRTFEAGDAREDMADHFRGRLDALARTQVIVTQTAAGTADLENLIRDELMSVGVRDGPDVRIGGPDVMLSSRLAESLGLAVHELTTNALKYGALKVDGAQLDISWTAGRDADGMSRLDLVWQEQGVPAIALEPVREGFGRELIEEALPYRLGARTRIELRGGGLRCTLSLPLDAAALRPRPIEDQAR